MVRMLILIALNRNLVGEPVYLRCANCGTCASSLEGAALRTSHRFTTRAGSVIDSTTTPPEWECPNCGRQGPLEVGEELANDTTMRCRRRFLCRYSWRVPATVTTVTCPRCYTVQSRPASRSG